MLWSIIIKWGSIVFCALQDYNDHVAEISAKLVAIMDSLFEKVLSKVRATVTLSFFKDILHTLSRLIPPLCCCCFPQYEVKAPMPSACFRNVCKQMSKMHEAISELLPEEQMQVGLDSLFCNIYIYYIII